MLQSTSASFTPRPKPPRSRSNQLANSTSNKHLDSGLASSANGKGQPSNHVQDVLRYVQQQTSVMIPETPPYTPELLSSELCHSQEGQDGSHGTPQDLEELLALAQRTIQERERDLGLAASLGKTLLDNNTALRSRQAAFLQRVASPVKVFPKSRFREDSQPAWDHLQIPLYGAKGEFIESLPPRSPRHSLILQRRQRQTSQEEGAWTDEEEEDYLVKHPSVTRPYVEQDSILDARSPSKKRNSAGHSRQISTSSTSSHTSGYNYSPNKVSKSISERQLAISLHLQEQHQQLASQNAELEEQLQDLELELQRADTSGKKKLRKLDRELDTLRQELQSALDRNRELEESLQRDKKSSSGSVAVSSTHRSTNARRFGANSPHTRHAQEISLPPDTDSNEGLYSPPLPTVDPAFLASQIVQHTGSPDLATGRDAPEAVVVSQLLQKIAELKETNAAIEQDKIQMDAKLQKASEEFEEMKRKYDFLEDRVIEAEVRAHRVIGWDRRATIGWYSGWEQDEQKLKISPQRRAIGNRAMIERHRRLSSLFGGYPPPPQLYRSNAASAIPSEDGSPETSRPRRSLHDSDMLRDPFMNQESASPTKKGQVGSPVLDYSGMATKSDDLEDLIDAMHRQVALDKEQIFAHQQSLLAGDALSSEDLIPEAASNASFSSPAGAPDLWENAEIPTTTDQTALLAMTIVASLSEPAKALSVDRNLLPPGPPDAESYEAMERALFDMPVEWADDDASVVQRSLLRDVPDGSSGKRAPTRQGGLEWAYEDPEEQSSEHDPWKDENGNKDQLGLESREMIDFRQRVDERSESRRKRIQQLAEELLQDEKDAQALSAEQTLVALRRVGSDKSISGSDDGGDGRSESSGSGEYEHVNTDRRSGSTGTDYWPISTRARYAPNMVAKRVAVTSQEYVNMCLLWTKFIAVLGVAVAVSMWRGPKEGLGSARLSPARRAGLVPSKVAARRRRIGSMDSIAPAM